MNTRTWNPITPFGRGRWFPVIDGAFIHLMSISGRTGLFINFSATSLQYKLNFNPTL